ncbi:ERAD-associated protein [Mortierella sp. AM989]|nr:ERAD-associated protein [Mortierella sp. AM989]
MDSPEQSPSPAENDGQIKGVMCPLSPSSSQASPALDVSVSSSNSCSPLPDKEQRIDADDDDDVVVGLETVFEAREPSSETKASTHGSNIPAAETISGGESLECTNTPFQSDYSQRPAISYAGLIIQVLLESTKTKMTLADIYSAIMQKHPYYRHAASGWQASNSVRNSLSLNKAFAKVDRTPDEPGHGCFWALQSHVRESSDPLPCRKRKAQQSDIPVTARSKGASLPKLDCVADSPSERSISSSTPSFPDSAPSPAASEDAEDLKSPRRSGRARRPPRPKEAEEYIGLHTRQSSQPSVPLSTPPSSPSPYGQDREVTPVTTPARKRASSVKIERIQIATTMIHPSTPRDEAPLSANSVSAPAAARKVTQDVDLASIPGVVTTPRIRRPPQNLAEFVSSEDFKAAPYGKRQERTLQSSSSSSSLNGAQSDASLRERKEAKRSKSESHISFCNSGMRANRLEMDQQHAELEQQDESLDRSPSIPNLAAASRFSHLNPSARPATIPLSALSHSKRGSQDSSCLNSKKQRRDASSRSKALYNKRHSSHEVPTRQQILDRRRQDGKREIMVASEDDWSDSDFDFLRDEEENYRLMRIRVRKIQRTCGRWSLRNEVDDGYVDVTGDDDYNSEEEHSHTEEEKIKLLMDPSVINYGFDSCDGEYILDYHQGPLFNNVTWPEFSDVKGDSGNSSSNPGNSSSSTNSSNVDTIGKGTDAVDSIADIHVLESVIEEGILVPDLAIEQADIDSQIVAEVLSAMTKSVILGSESIHPTERIPAIQTAVSALPPVMSSTCIDEKDRKEEADEWTLFVGNCDPKMECNTGASCRNMDVESETKLNIVSSLEHILPESEIAAVVAAVNAGAITETIPAQMEGIVVQTVPVAVRVKEEIEAEDFIGWSLFLLAVALVANADTANQDSISVEPSQLNLGVEKFNDHAKAQERIENGKKLYQEAMQLLESSSFRINQRVFIKQQSLLARSFLSDELQKQKGVFPTAFRLVTQGLMSFFKPAPTTDSSSSPPSTAKGNEEAQEPSKAPIKRHRDPTVAKAMELLQLAGYEYDNDDALWTLANIYFHGQYKAKRDLNQAFNMYATMADRSGNSSAQQMVGFMYSTGLGNVVQRNEAKAVLYTTFAARGGNTAAELTLGYKYMLGIGTKKSCQESVVYYKRAADKAHDMYMSGPPLGRTMPPIKLRLADGEGGTYGAGASGPGDPSPNVIASDIKDFIEFHRYIADGENPQAKAAQFQLGFLYYSGNAGSRTTIPRDYQKAGEYLRRVADAFFNPKTNIAEAKELRAKEVEDAGIAAALLGKMYWRGEGFEVDEHQALSWFEKGASVDNPAAFNALGTMHMKGAAGLQVDHETAIKYFKKAASLNYPDAQVNMGLIYLNDPKHHLVAYEYFVSAAKHQNFQAIYHLGEMYFYGLGVNKKCDEAARYFKYVAERGDWGDTLFPDSYDAYQAGDIEYAAIGYLQAAERGFDVGQSNFAWILDRELPTSHYLTSLTSPSRTALAAISESALVNLGTPSRLLEMALVYWTRAANLGDVDARVKMGDYYFAGIGTEVDYKKATVCYQVAAEVEHSAMAMWNLGWMHENGVGVAKDFHLAKRWYDMSLVTNQGALLPVSLSLLKLNAKYIWNYLTGGDTGSETGSFWSIGSKSESSGSTLDSSEKISKDGSGGSSNNKGGSEQGGGRVRSKWDLDGNSQNEIEKWKSQKKAAPGLDDESDPFQHRQRQGEDEDFLEDDDMLETIVIVGLCMVVGYLMYIRQFRFANQGQQQNQNQDQDQDRNQNQNPGPVVEGLPGDPNAPGRYAYYAAGG